MNKIFPLTLVAAAVFAGCHSPSKVQTPAPSVAAPQPFKPMFITTRGTNTTPDGTWSIAVPEADGSLHLTYIQEFRSEGAHDVVSTSSSPSGWRAREGWFVYIETPYRVWAYDGDRSLILKTQTPGRNGGSEICGPRRFPCAVPPEVFSRLSEPAQKAIQPRE